MAVGDLMGSSLFNLLILGILDLSHHSRGRMLSRASAAHALSATLSIALTALAAMSILVGLAVRADLRWPRRGELGSLDRLCTGGSDGLLDQRLSAERGRALAGGLVPRQEGSAHPGRHGVRRCRARDPRGLAVPGPLRRQPSPTRPVWAAPLSEPRWWHSALHFRNWSPR